MIAIVVAILIIGAAVGFFALVPPVKVSTTTTTTTSSTASCPALAPVKDDQLKGTTYDAVTEYALPSPNLGPNALAVAPDGSAWFTVNGLPGVGHLYPNGTLTEYKLPFPYDPDTSDCNSLTYDWGIALWNGSVWALNEDSSVLIGLNTATGAISNVTLQSQANPYTLAVGANKLWFTQFYDGPTIGSVTPGNYTVQYHKLPGNSSWSSAYVYFQNDTRGYVLAIDTSLSIYPNAVDSLLYSFNPELSNPTFQQVGGNVTLNEPTAIAVGEGGIWLTEHSASNLAFFNTTSSTWTFYPTSTVPYVPVTLTYFDVANATSVWFNEHYGNKIGVIYDGATRLAEYSVSNPPVSNFTDVLEGINTLTVGQGDNMLWFTQWSASVVGFVNQSYAPPFSISLVPSSGASGSTIRIPAGGSAQLQLQISGQSASNMSVEFSDNEYYNSSASQLTFTPSVGSIPSLNGNVPLNVTISAATAIKPGTYVAAITVTNGLVLTSVYETIVVT